MPEYRLKQCKLFTFAVCILICFSGCFLLPEKLRWEDDEFAIATAKKGLMVPGEKLTYVIKAGIFTLGKAELTIKTSEKDPDKLELALFANSSHPWLPSLSYTYKSTVNRNDFSTVIFEMEEMEKSEVKKSAVFTTDYSTNKGTFILTKKKKVKKGILNLTGKTYDYISLIYYLRKNLPQPGEQVELPIFNETEIISVKARNLATREIVLNNIGKFKASIIKPKREFEGIFFKRGDIQLWIDTTYLIPLRIIIQLPLGTGIIELVKAENTQTGEVFIP